MNLSVIIPALNEAHILVRTLSALDPRPAEIIVVDGGSRDDTLRVAREFTHRVFVSPKGRGRQQAMGTRLSKGDVLVFLHADTVLPAGYGQCIHQALADPNTVYGAFSLRISPSTPMLDLVAFMAHLRSRLLKLPYGDQALFVRRKAYFRAGGFPDLPIMEDVALVRRLNRLGGFRLARACVQTSARRWQKEGLARTTFRNWSLIIRYGLGVSPRKLARYYPDTR